MPNLEILKTAEYERAFSSVVIHGRGSDAELRTMTEGSETGGGNLVPASWTDRVFAKLGSSDILSRCTIINPAGRDLQPPAVSTEPTITTQIEGDTPNSGDLAFTLPNMAKPGESANRRALRLQSVPFLGKASFELLADSEAGPSLEAALREQFATSVITYIESKIVNGIGDQGLGDGVNAAPEPMGLVGSCINESQVFGVNSQPEDLKLADYTAPLTLVKPAHIANGVFILSTLALRLAPESVLLALSGSSDGRLLGRPTIFTPFLDDFTEASGERGASEVQSCAAIFADLSRYVVAIAPGFISIQRLTERFADSGLIGFSCRTRVDGALVTPTAAGALVRN